MDDFEPMDVDRSGSTISKMDISYLESDSDRSEHNTFINLTSSPKDNFYKVVRTSPRVRPGSGFLKTKNPPSESQQGNSPRVDKSSKFREKTNIKTYHIQRVHKDKTPACSYQTIFVGISVVFLLIPAVFIQLTKMKCVDEIDIRSVRKSFTEHLYGQNVAANKIIEMLNMKVSSKIMFLYGGTGVGKTYAVSLMLESLWNSANIYHYTMPSFADSFSPELMFGLIVCKTSVVVVDGLNENHIHIKSHVKNVITKSDNLGKNITVILIYNCDNINDNFVKKCDSNFKSELQKQFSDINSEKEYIKFETLTEEHLKKCIEKELGDRKVQRHEMDNIMKNFDVFSDGCKGVYTKVKFFNVV